MNVNLDEDAVIAAVDLVGRTGAKDFQFGYLHDDKPIEEAGWYAHAQYRGTRITVEDHRGPVEACEALARKLLTGAKCQHCGGLVALSDAGAVAFNGRLLDGTEWTVEQAKAAGQCRWRRMGDRWKRGCEDGPIRTARPARQPSQGQRSQPRSKKPRKRR